MVYQAKQTELQQQKIFDIDSVEKAHFKYCIGLKSSVQISPYLKVFIICLTA